MLDLEPIKQTLWKRGEEFADAARQDLPALIAEVERLQDFVESFLSPERNGYAVPAHVRDQARIALGVNPVESIELIKQCEQCKGSGVLMAYRGEPSQGKEETICIYCRGKGFVLKEQE